jgi:hypothetical protein
MPDRARPRVKDYIVTPVNKGGRPSKIDEPCTLANGDPGSVAEGIISRIRAGAYLETACAACGVHVDTAQTWKRTGRAAWTKVMSGHTPAGELREYERKCLDFLQGIEKAEADWLVRAEASLEQMVRGGQTTTRTTVRKDPKGNVIETIEVTEHHPVDPRILQWRMERRYPQLYGRRQVDVNVGGQADNPVIATNVTVDDLLDKLQAVAAGVLNPPADQPALGPVNGHVVE